MFYGYNEQGYLDALRYIRERGVEKKDRTGTGTFSIFGAINLEFDLMFEGKPILPLLTTKKIFHRSVVHELIWMLSGSSRVKYLKDNNVSIWDNWVLPGTEEYRMLEFGERIRMLNEFQSLEFRKLSKLEFESDAARLETENMYLNAAGIPEKILVDGDLGPVYGAQWRHWEDIRSIDASEMYNGSPWEKYGSRGYSHVGTLNDGTLAIKRKIDQIALIETALRGDQDSRRIILSAWNVSRIDEMALPPCHTLAQWAVEDGVLHCKLYQRSGDFFIGVPWNFAFYALMTHMLAEIHGLQAGKLFHTFGDAHIYSNHIDQVDEQLSRDIIPGGHGILNLLNYNYTSITEFEFDDIEILKYESNNAIKAPIAV